MVNSFVFIFLKRSSALWNKYFIIEHLNLLLIKGSDIMQQAHSPVLHKHMQQDI